MNLKIATIIGTLFAAVAAPATVFAEETAEECSTIAEIACSLEDFSTLCTLVGIAGLGETLSGGSFTVFAPTNDAFAAIPADLVEFLTTDEEEGIPTLIDILLYHVVGEPLFAADIVTDEVCTGGMDQGLIEMANGEDTRTICCHSCGEKIFQKGAGNPREGSGSAFDNQDIWPQIVATDVEACNGVIHVVNQVILP